MVYFPSSNIKFTQSRAVQVSRDRKWNMCVRSAKYGDRILMVWVASPDLETSPRNAIYIACSDDMGGTWTDPSKLWMSSVEGSYVINPIILVSRQGSVFILYLDNGHKTARGPLISKLCELHSPLEVTSWSSPEPLSFEGDDAKINGLGIFSSPVIFDDSIVFPCYYNSTENRLRGVALICNCDMSSCRTSEPFDVPYGPGADEPAFARTKNDGEIACLFRTTTKKLWQTRSADRGETWEPPTESPLENAYAPVAMVYLEDSERVLAVWSRVNLENGRNVLSDPPFQTPRHNLTASVMDNNGSWSKPQVMLETTLVDLTYFLTNHGLLYLGKDRILLQYFNALEVELLGTVKSKVEPGRKDDLRGDIGPIDQILFSESLLDTPISSDWIPYAEQDSGGVRPDPEGVCIMAPGFFRTQTQLTYTSKVSFSEISFRLSEVNMSPSAIVGWFIGQTPFTDETASGVTFLRSGIGGTSYEDPPHSSFLSRERPLAPLNPALLARVRPKPLSETSPRSGEEVLRLGEYLVDARVTMKFDWPKKRLECVLGWGKGLQDSWVLELPSIPLEQMKFGFIARNYGVQGKVIVGDVLVK